MILPISWMNNLTNFFLQLRQQKRWFIVYMLHSATTKKITSPKITGPGQRTKRDPFDMSKVGLSKVVKVIRIATDVPDPLRQVLDSRHAIQQFVPALLTSDFPIFCFCGFHGYTGLLGPLPHLSSFVLQPVHSLLPPLHSHGMEVSQKMALRPRNLFIFSWRIIALQCCVGFHHTSTWISHGRTYAPSLLNLPPHPTPPGNQSPGFELPVSTANSYQLPVSHTVMCMFQY